MPSKILLVALLALPVAFPFQDSEPEAAISSEILTTKAKELILVQRGEFDVPVEELWKAYVTEEGWTSWASPVAEIDLRVGGTIRTHYGEGAKIGDPGTNTLHIVNYVPNKLLTLRAEIGERWPEIMKQDADNLSNVILFEELGEKRCRVLSYGIGYRQSPEYDSLLQFFSQANEDLMRKLKQQLEAK